MPKSLESSQREKEGRFYSQKYNEKKPDQIEQQGQGGLRISYHQLSTQTALGICLLLTLVDSVESAKISEKIVSSQKLAPTRTSPKTLASRKRVDSLNNLIIASERGDLGIIKTLI